MTKEQFHKKHGREWAKIVKTKCFRDAIATVEGNSDILQVIQKSPAEVSAYGQVMLAKQQGFLAYGNDLSSLHQEPEKELEDLGAPKYIDPVEEVED